jgi:hypothetical protein
MSVGLKLWVFFLGGAAILGLAWFLWARLIGFPRHDPTVSAPPDPNVGGELQALQSEELRHHSGD